MGRIITILLPHVTQLLQFKLVFSLLRILTAGNYHIIVKESTDALWRRKKGWDGAGFNLCRLQLEETQLSLFGAFSTEFKSSLNMNTHHLLFLILQTCLNIKRAFIKCLRGDFAWRKPPQTTKVGTEIHMADLLSSAFIFSFPPIVGVSLFLHPFYEHFAQCKFILSLIFLCVYVLFFHNILHDWCKFISVY